METLPAERSRRGVYIAFAIGLLAVAGVLAWVVLRRVPAGRFAAPGAPIVHLNVAVMDERTPVGVDHSRLASTSGLATPVASDTPQTVTPTAVAAWQAAATATPEPSERSVDITLARAPFGLSLYVMDGAALLAWMEKDPAAVAWLDSELVQGMFQDLLRALRVRGEDLKLPGVQGAFVSQLGRDVLSAGAAVHYDPSRGRRGFVFSFDRKRSALASRLLPVTLAALTRRQYRVERAELVVFETLIGEQTVFVTERADTVYFASSLAGALNAAEVELEPAPPKTEHALTLRLRAEAWMRDLLPAVTGKEQWHASWGLTPGSPNSAGKIESDGGRMFDHLHPTLATGILASIPRDVFVAAAGSFAFPTVDDAAAAPRFPLPAADRNSAGIALVWDLTADHEGLSQVGLAAYRPDSGSAPELTRLVAADAFATRCAGGSIWLAASAEPLLTRMREACERQSPSLLDLEPATGGKMDSQLLIALNPAAALGELLHHGIGKAAVDRVGENERAPEWKKSYDAAVAQAGERGDATLASLPQLLYRGGATSAGASLDGVYLPRASRGVQ